MYKLSKTARIFKNGNLNIISVGVNQYIVENDEYVYILKILEFVKEEKTENQVRIFLENEGIDESVLEKLVSSNMITRNENLFEKRDTIDFKNELYLDVLIENSSNIMQKIAEYTFVIVGAGGIGNYISYGISGYNPKKMIIIDGDIIEVGNLNRQFLFNMDNIGQSKVSTLERALKKLENNNIEVYEQYCDFKLLDDIVENEKRKDRILIIVSGDSDNVLEDVTKVAIKYEIPFLNIGYLNDISVIGPFYIPQVSSCPFCNDTFSLSEELNENEIYEYVNKQSTAPSAFVNNAIASSMALVDIFKYIAGEYESMNSLNRRVGLSNSDFKKMEIFNEKDTNCKFCSNKR